MDTKSLANKIAKQHSTRDPFRVAEDLGFIVIRTPLIGSRGLHQKVKRRTIIYINSDLDEQQQRIVCAHELGHHYMHRGMNRLFMDSGTCMVTNKFENEANRFALDFIYEDMDLLEYLEWPLARVSEWMGVSTSLASYRMRSLHNDIF